MKISSKLLLLLLLSVSFSSFAQDKPVHVTILHVNDVYQFQPVDRGERGGLARLMTIKKDAVDENPNTIFTLGGDTISPSVESMTYKGAQMIDAWNLIGLDYSVLGNHEFDFKTADLLARMKESKFKWLGANVWDTQTNAVFAGLPPYELREFDGVKVGIIGLLLPETAETSSMEKTLRVKGYCETAREIVPKMRAAGINTIIGLTHLFMEQDKELAKCADIDLILGGHEHTLLQSSSNGVPIFKMTADAREVGKFELYIDRKTGKLQSMDWTIIPVDSKTEDAPEFIEVLAKYKDKLVELNEKVGATAVELDATSLSSRTKETNVGNFVADTYRAATGAEIALVNGGSIRADFLYSPGKLKKRDVLAMMPFNNQIVKIEMDGKLLRRVLEHGVARSGPGEDGEPGRFPQVSGVTFTFDAAKPVGSRITELLVGGKPVDDNRKYTLATSYFLVSRGGDGYTMLAEAKMLTTDMNTAPRDTQLFENAIKNAPNKTISPRLEGRISRIN